MFKWVFVTIIILVSAFSYKIKAADTGISISPASNNITLKTQGSHSGEFTISNNEEIPLSINLKEYDVIDQVPTQASLYWIELSSLEFTLDSRGTKLIEYKLTVPESTPKGAYTKAIVLEVTNKNNNESLVVMQIPYTINIFVDSTFSSEVGTIIKEFVVSQKLLISNIVNFNLTIDNPATSQVSKPIINLNVISNKGQIVYTKVLNENLKMIYDSETYNIDANIPLSDLLDIGQYRAEVLVTDTLTNKSAVKKTTFFYVNYILIVLLIVTIISLILLTRFNKALKNILNINYSKKPGKIGSKKFKD